MSNELNTIMAFNGSDFVIYLDDKLCTDVCEFKVDHVNKTIKLTSVLFQQCIIKTEEIFTAAKSSKLTQFFCNEEGSKMEKSYLGVTYVGEEYTHNIEDECLTHTFLFVFESCEPYKKK